MLTAKITIDRQHMADLCRAFGVARLRLFGSAQRDDFDVQRSDVDLLVEFLPGVSKSLFKLAELQEALVSLFGRDVDLMTPANLSKYFRDDVLKSAEVLFKPTLSCPGTKQSACDIG